MRKQNRWLIFCAMCLGGLNAFADLTPPDWVLDDDVVSVLYRFETNSTNPPASDSSGSLIADSEMEINKVTFASGGWAGPDNAYNVWITRENGGVWEVGETGYFNLFLPLVSAPSADLYVEFFVEVIAAQGIETLPGISVINADSLEVETDVFEPDPLGMFSWVQLGCTGLVSLASSTGLSVIVSCLDDGTTYRNSSAVDQIAVYTRVIPEPASGLLLAVFGLLFLLRRHLFS